MLSSKKCICGERLNVKYTIVDYRKLVAKGYCNNCSLIFKLDPKEALEEQYKKVYS